MGVPFLNTLFIFLVYQILHSSSVSGLPFASISAIPSLKTAETLPCDETAVTSSTTSSLVNSDLLSSPVEGTLSSNNFQLFIGTPDTIFFSPLNPPLMNCGKNDQISSAEASNLNLLTSLNLQSSFVPSNPAYESGLCINSDSNISSQVTSTPTLTSGLSIVPTLKVDLNSSNFKRELRDTISVSQESCTSNTVSPLSSQTGFLSPFSSVPSFANLKPIIPCVACRLPVNFTQSPRQDNFIVVENLQDSNKLSNVINCHVPSRSLPVLTNVRPCISPFQNNVPLSQETSNAVTFNSFDFRNILPNCAANKLNILRDTSSPCSYDSGEVINVEQPSISSVNTLSSLAALNNYVKSRQNSQPCLNSDTTQNQPNIENNAPASQCGQVNNNLMLAQALQNNKILSQQSPLQTLMNNQPNNIVQDSQNNIAGYENQVNPYDDKLAAEFENVLRIRNNVIPQMLSNNVRVKNIPQNNIQTNNDNSGCPQLQTVQVENDVPFVQSNTLILDSGNNCGFANNNLGSNGYISLNNIARMIKDNRDNNNNGVSQNNNQGCPQLMSIPIYNKESLLNKQFIRLSSPNNECSQNQNDNCDQALTLPNNNINFNNNILTLNQENQGCPQLLALAQKNLCATKNSGNNINMIVNNQNCDSLQEFSQNINFNDNYNCIQMPTPNDNLAQALKLKNLAKNQPCQVPEATINILPFGKTLLDGKPISNNYISLDSTGPMQLSSCTDSCNSNNFLSIQDVSAMPFSSTPVNQLSCVTPLDSAVTIPTNIMLAPSFSSISTGSPITTNIVPSVINLAPSVPNIASITATESTIVNQPLVYNPGSFCNNNIQPMFTLLDNNFNSPLTSSTTLSGISPLLSTDSIFIQSLPQTLNDNCISSLSNLPPVCTSIQPVISPTYINPLLTASPQCNSVSDVSTVFPSLNNVVSSLTQNIISTLITKAIPSTGVPLANLPPVNPFSSTVGADSSINSPICLDISEPVQYVSAPRLSLPDIPVACNEYLPPVYNSAILPLSFNSELFCVESDSTFDSCPLFALSKTDAYYPEISFMVPTVGSSDCSRLCGPLFMPASSLPQSSPVLKINSAGRGAKGFDQLISTLVF